MRIEKQNCSEITRLLNKVGEKATIRTQRLRTNDICTLVGRSLTNIIKLSCSTKDQTKFTEMIKAFSKLSVDELIQKRDAIIAYRENRRREVLLNVGRNGSRSGSRSRSRNGRESRRSRE